MAVTVGDKAPEFTLPGTDGTDEGHRDYSLSDYRGEVVVLVFYPGDNTPVCTRQFCSYRDNAEAFGSLDATVVGISSQSVESHESFTAEHGLNAPLLADEDGKVAKAYGAHAPVVGTKRAAIIVDEEGLVRYRHDHLLGLDFQSVDDLREALDSVAASA
jgi:thioredoxin-dependent peroxiredoxin